MGSEEEDFEAEMEQLLPADEELEVFARVIEPLGKRWFRVECSDGVIRMARVRGKLRSRRHWIKRGDIVLISIWPFKRDRGDIAVRYNHQQIAWLIKKGFIDKNWVTGEEVG